MALEAEVALFNGDICLESLRENLRVVPASSGVYIIRWSGTSRPKLIDPSPAGWHEGRDPTIAVADLAVAWVTGAEFVYVGYTHGQHTSLRVRLRQLVQFGNGQRVGHWGGRAIWQITEQSRLHVSWRTTSSVEAKDLRDLMLALFREKHGVLPFANLRE